MLKLFCVFGAVLGFLGLERPIVEVLAIERLGLAAPVMVGHGETEAEMEGCGGEEREGREFLHDSSFLVRRPERCKSEGPICALVADHDDSVATFFSLAGCDDAPRDWSRRAGSGERRVPAAEAPRFRSRSGAGGWRGACGL